MLSETNNTTYLTPPALVIRQDIAPPSILNTYTFHDTR